MTTQNPEPRTQNPVVKIIGGGLAGSEAAWQAARRGVRVRLYEMKPQKFSPAHQSPLLGELVCSNSLRAEGRESAVGLLKEEMRRLDSLIMAAALATRVPAGKALAVDRGEFAAHITRVLEAEPLIEIIREEVEAPDPEATTIIATGPLTSDPLAEALGRLTGQAAPPLLRRHRPHRGGGVHRPDKKSSGPPATGPGTITSTARSAKPSTPPFTRP